MKPSIFHSPFDVSFDIQGQVYVHSPLRILLMAVAVLCGAGLSPAASLLAAAPAAKSDEALDFVLDPRHISRGAPIPSEGYADQPYIVKTRDGAWLCVMTTGPGIEGAGGQHVISLRSSDQGRTWGDIVAIEPSSGPEASYAVLLLVPEGRIYVFYNHNSDRVREVKREDGGVYARVDSLGHYVFKYSDDHGRSWSAERHDVPVREFECDRLNVYGGSLRFFWNVGRPLILGDSALLVIHKVGAMGAGFFAQSEGAFLWSPDILRERDPEKIRFETLPEGDIGLRAPPGGGRVAEEQSVVALSDGTLYCVYRTVDGWPACSYSRDGARTWTIPGYMSYTPGGRRVKHPRAANFVWRCTNGKFLYWFHNHGGPFIRDSSGGRPFEDRNPAWVLAGVERDTPEGKVLEWSQPEILLYDDDPFIRMSYPDLVEDGGKFYVTETQKNAGRVHEVPKAILDGLFGQWELRSVATQGLLLDLDLDLELDLADGKPRPGDVPMPRLPPFHERNGKRADHGGRDLRAGFSVDLWLELPTLEPGQVLFDSRDAAGEGILVSTIDRGRLRLVLSDGRSTSSWDSDAGALRSQERHHVVMIVDGGPKIIGFVVDGVLCDGGDERQFGWGRFSPTLRTPRGAARAKVGSAVRSLRIYGRALRTSEAVGNWRAGGRE